MLYKFKLYRSKWNRKLHRQIQAAGLAYNHCIALHKRYYRLFHKGLNKYKLQKHLAKISKLPRFRYLKEFGSQVVQNVTERISSGYKKFSEKQNKKPPKFRKLHKFKSFTLKQAGWKLDEKNHAIVIKGQKYRYHKSRDIDGIIKTVTVKRDRVGDIYIFFSCEVQQNEVIPFPLRRGRLLSKIDFKASNSPMGGRLGCSWYPSTRNGKKRQKTI